MSTSSLASAFTPSECLSLLAVISDACKEVDTLYNISHKDFQAQNATSVASRGQQSNPDTLLAELNKIFFQTLLRYEKARKEDYLELPDGTCRKLNDEESTRVKYLEIVSGVSNTLKSLLLEIDDSGSTTSLERFCNQEQAELAKLENFVISASEKERNVSKLQNDVRTLQYQMEEETENFLRTIASVKHEFQELREMSKMTLLYKSKEYATRLDQEVTRHNNECKELTENVDHVRFLIRNNTRVQEETCSWLYMDISNRQNLAEFLPHTVKSVQVASELAALRATLAERKEQHQQLQKQFEEFDFIVEASKREKATIRLREEFASNFLISVVQIQSWWRTLIELHGIRFRRKGKRKGKKKK